MNLIQSRRALVLWLVGAAALAQMASAVDEPNGIFPNDPLFPLQWNLHNTGQSGAKPGVDINAAKAWEITTGDPNIIVAFVGEGIDLEHPDLVNNLVPGYDFYDKDDRPEPSYEEPHGAYETVDAGIIAAEGNNGIGVTGVTWHCKIMPVRCWRRSGGWVEPHSAPEVANGYRWAATHGADVIHWNHNGNGPVPSILRSAYIDITKPGGIGRNGKGCVLVGRAFMSAAGPGYVYDAIYPEWISVHAVDPWDNLLVPHDPAARVDLVAPVGDYKPGSYERGTVVSWSTDIAGLAGYGEGDYCETWGQTKACALVSGVAALILSIEPDLTSEEVRHYLCRSAHDLGVPDRDEEYGWGRVDARAALDMVLAARADLNQNGVVDEEDLAILTTAIETQDLAADIAPAAKRDGVVDEEDRELLLAHLGTEYPPFGLLAHWKLDETEGDTAQCSEGIPTALHGGPVWQSDRGRIGGALLLDGADDYVETPFVLDPSAGPFSAFVWIKGGAPGQVILSQAEGAVWLMADPRNGALQAQVSGSRMSLLTSLAVVTDGQWHRVGLVWDGSKRSLYVDDIEVAGDTHSLAMVKSTGGLHLGAGSKLEAGTFWSGPIDDVRIYDRAVQP